MAKVKKIRIGITGQEGFVGNYLFNTIGLFPEKYERIFYDRSFFNNEKKLQNFVSKCDVIIHLAAINRHKNSEVLYETNINLVNKLIFALEKSNTKTHVLFSSSSQEDKENLYGKSKKDGREMLANWARRTGNIFTGLIIPNVFGPFGMPNYNSFIATFCHKLTHGEKPEIKFDSRVNLIYISELVDEILIQIERSKTNEFFKVPFTSTKKVSEVLSTLVNFKENYFEKGKIPNLKTSFDFNLFNTFRSYFDLKKYYPVNLVKHTDNRGAFVEIIRSDIGGQNSFSTTVPKITRGNHYHTRKIERFTVIKGKALIQLRRVGTRQIFDFYLDGSSPAFVDMPVWYTHNIKNIGDDELVTVFWINEPYDPNNPDTFYEIV